ncbi:hypothetical protein ASC96_31135 [Rhizobium sp. Root1204]|nr:hypothetical protein ASC96_31135 [Rhizobium sp. Root1204]
MQPAQARLPPIFVEEVSVRAEDSVTPADGLARGAYVCLGVRDTGSGMDEETVRRAVDPFFSTKELGKGTGLGLSMIHGLAVQLYGALKLISTLGGGHVGRTLASGDH